MQPMIITGNLRHCAGLKNRLNVTIKYVDSQDIETKGVELLEARNEKERGYEVHPPRKKAKVAAYHKPT